MSKEAAYRTITALLLAPVFVLIVIFGGIPFFLIISSVAIISYLEICYMMEQAGFLPSKLPGSITVILLLIGTYLQFELTLFLLTTLLVSSLFWAKSPEKATSGFIGNLFTTFVGVFYAGGLLSHTLLLRALPEGHEWILAVLFGTWAADTGAYLVGKTWGKRKLVPSISPGKTWEGAVGGTLLSFLVVLVTCTAFEIGLIYAIGTAIIIPVVSIVGDVTMSAVKRSVGVKDTGKILPGHGGLLDRIDSLIFALPVVYYYVVAVTAMLQ